MAVLEPGILHLSASLALLGITESLEPSNLALGDHARQGGLETAGALASLPRGGARLGYKLRADGTSAPDYS